MGTTVSSKAVMIRPSQPMLGTTDRTTEQHRVTKGETTTVQQMPLTVNHLSCGCVRKCDFLFFAGYGSFHLGKPLEICIDNTKFWPLQAGIFLGSPMDSTAQGMII